MPVVLITGCTTGGIGQALADEFAARGCVVYATSRRLDSMKFASPSVHTKALDVTDDEMTLSVVSEIEKEAGRIDILVNNAGNLGPNALIDNSMDTVKKVFEVNTFSPLRLAKAVIPAMAARRSGLIMNIGSVVGEISTPWQGLYCSTKAALHSLTDTLFMETKPLGIKVMLVAPGSIRSNIANNASRGYQLPEGSLYKDYLPNIIQRIYASQQRPMAAEVFARKVVAAALRKDPPYYLTLGTNSTTFWILKNLFSRVFSLNFIWKYFSKKQV